jgi:hypothetical protein
LEPCRRRRGESDSQLFGSRRYVVGVFDSTTGAQSLYIDGSLITGEGSVNFV